MNWIGWRIWRARWVAAAGVLWLSQGAMGAGELSAGFKVFDKPSDDGSAVTVAWDRPAGEKAGVKYVIEVAKTPGDFEAGKFKTQDVAVAEGKGPYSVDVVPAKMFPPAAPAATLSAERLRELAAGHVLTEAEAARAERALTEMREEKELNAAERADRQWLERLKSYLRGKDQEGQKAEAAAINGGTHYYRLAVRDGELKTYVTEGGSPVVVSAAAVVNYFKWDKRNNLIFSVVFGAIVLAFIQVARRRPNLFIRRIAGLDAVDEAIGRATETDRPVFFVHGRLGVGDQATMAALNILSQVAKRIAAHDSRLRVTNSDPVVTAASQEVVQQAYAQAGRPDAYKPDDIALVASDQFSYAAAVSGMMIREQPAAVFFMGSFAAESLLLAETGASTGAIQVAGTDAYTQLPFFVTTCDYTLIGEELFAASAYLSRDARTLGSLRGQDIGKAFLMVTIVGGSLALTIALYYGGTIGWLVDLLKA